MNARPTAKFPLGQIVATPAALAALEESGQTPDFFLDRHSRGDWGEVSGTDGHLNDEALQDGTRLFSVYHTLKGKKVWVITEADRSATALLLPDDY